MKESREVLRMSVYLIESPNSSTAWCMDRKGNLYSVYVHPFGSLQDDSLEDAAWLYCNGFQEVASVCVSYYALTMWLELGFDPKTSNVEDFIIEVIDSVFEIECLRGNNKQKQFASALHRYIIETLDIAGFDIPEADVNSWGKMLKDYLNQNILRIRFGSEFETRLTNSGSLYFRTSSSGYDWYDHILKFIDKLSSNHRITDITIERDKETTGSDKVYVNHMPLNEFLLEKPIVVESVRRACNG